MTESTAPQRILYAEDDPHIAKLVMFKLSKEGYEIDWVQNGNEALKSLNQSSYDLIILDVMMPVKDGLETLREIRQDPHAQSTPIMMMTAKSQDQDITQALESGATEYIIKPFDPQELAIRVATLLETSTS